VDWAESWELAGLLDVEEWVLVLAQDWQLLDGFQRPGLEDAEQEQDWQLLVETLRAWRDEAWELQGQGGQHPVWVAHKQPLVPQ
jgi:hypothetical protein